MQRRRYRYDDTRSNFMMFPSKISMQRIVTMGSLLLNVVLFVALRNNNNNYNNRVMIRSTGENQNKVVPLQSRELVWNGGHVVGKQSGSCWCSAYDDYCMCTPSLSIDLIVVTSSEHDTDRGDYLWLVRRKDTNQLATMGGFVLVGESIEEAVVRELQEEMGLTISLDSLELFGIYSDPRRDVRRHTASAVFVIHISPDIVPHAADDAKDVQRIAVADVEKLGTDELFADHKTILLDYQNSIAKHSTTRMADRTEKLPDRLARSLCTS